MAQWKRVLISGSHFTVRELQISEISAAQDGDTILFAGSASSADSGSFKTKDLYKIVNGGDLSGSFGTNSGNETSFEGDGADITGIDSATAEFSVKHGAGVGILNSSGNNIGFTGNQTGTFTISLKGASNFPGTTFTSEFNSQTAVNSKNLGVDGGILFATHSSQNKLILDPDLPGNGLEWDPIYLNGDIGNVLQVDLDGTNGGSSGIYRNGSNGLKISNFIGGDGLSLTNGVLDLDLTSTSGLTVSDGTMGTGKLSLASSIAGTGLTFTAPNDRSVINIDTSVVVTNETIDFEPKAYSDGGIWQNTISQGQGISNLLYGVIAASTNNVISNSEYALGTGTQTFLSNPTVYFELSKVWGNSASPNRADFSITGDVTIKGNLTIVSSSNVTNIQTPTFKTSDQFILLNSASDALMGTQAFQYYNGGIIANTHDTSGQMSGSALFYQSGSDSTIWGVTTEGQVAWNDINPGITDGGISDSTTIAAISTVKVGTANNPNSAADSVVGWDWSQQERRGNWYIEHDTDPTGGESNVWLYVAEQGDSGGGGGKGV